MAVKKSTTKEKVTKSTCKSTTKKTCCGSAKCATKKVATPAKTTKKVVKKNPGVTAACKEAKKALSKAKAPVAKKTVVSKSKEVVAPIQYVVTQTFVYGSSKVKQIVTKNLVLKESEKKVSKVKLLNKVTVEDIRKIIDQSSKLGSSYCKIKQELVKGVYVITLSSDKKKAELKFKNKILD